MTRTVQRAPSLVVAMGVSGTGKSSVGTLVAERLGLDFVEGDDYHPESNIAKMREGIALTDEDRRPWLQILADLAGRRLPRFLDQKG